MAPAGGYLQSAASELAERYRADHLFGVITAPLAELVLGPGNPTLVRVQVESEQQLSFGIPPRARPGSRAGVGARLMPVKDNLLALSYALRAGVVL